MTKTSTWAGHPVVVNDGKWYYDNNHNEDIYNKEDHVDDLRKGDGKTEPAAVAEAVAVATVGADNNQQRAAKMTAAAIAVGKRRQARGEKRGQWRGRWRGGGGGGGRRSSSGGRDGWWGEARGDSGGWGSTYTTLQLFGAK